MRNPDDAVAGDLQCGVPFPVTLESRPMTVKGETVQLHDQALTRPYRVYLEAMNRDIEKGRRQPVLPAELREALLQRRFHHGGFPRGGYQSTDRRRSSPALQVFAEMFERPQPQEPQAVRLFENALQPLRIDHPGQVQKRASRGGDGDPAAFGAFGRGDPTFMKVDAGSPSTSLRRSHIDTRPRCPQEAPKCRCAAMAEDCPVPVGQHSRHPMALLGQCLVRDGVYGAVNPMQSARPESDLDRPLTETQSCELSQGNDAVLSCSKRRQLTLASMPGGQLSARVSFCPHIGGQVHSRLWSAPWGGSNLSKQVGRQACRLITLMGRSWDEESGGTRNERRC